jgi:hypothetical protein
MMPEQGRLSTAMSIAIRVAMFFALSALTTAVLAVPYLQIQ